MSNYWCVNFDCEPCLRHGIHRKVWMMQYQYSDNQGNEFQGGRQIAATTKNWKRLGQIKAGDRIAAYLKGSRFFAVGTVIEPRKPMTDGDRADSIEEYIKRRESHRFDEGRVFYTDVFYEDFSDNWRHPDDPLTRYAQRIDVHCWDSYVPEGVEVGVLGTHKRPELQMAAFGITAHQFARIEKALSAAHKPVPSPGATAANSFIDDAVLESLETSQARGQGFLLDSELRKALEECAMKAAKRHFKADGYKCEDHSKNCPYDLRCERVGEILHVEVKGTQTDGTEVILTPGEVEFARKHKGAMALFLLHSIQVEDCDDGYELSGGEQRVIVPWDVDGGILKPVSFKYEIPNGG